MPGFWFRTKLMLGVGRSSQTSTLRLLQASSYLKKFVKLKIEKKNHWEIVKLKIIYSTYPGNFEAITWAILTLSAKMGSSQYICFSI